MDRLLLHLLLLGWASIGTAGWLTSRRTDRLLAAGLLAWGNLVVTSLVLSAGQKLGEPSWFLTVSILLAAATGLVAWRTRRAPDSTSTPAEAPPSAWLQGAFVATLTPFVAATLTVAFLYPTNNPDSLVWHLPRTLFYLGQGNLSPFDAGDARLVLLPFNHNLGQLFVFLYGPPAQCLNFFNSLSWAFAGIAVYRLCRLGGAGANASLVTSWLVLVATPVIAQAATTTPELSAGAAMIGAAVFAVRWARHRRGADAWLAGLAVGLAAGSSWPILILLLVAGSFGLIAVRRSAAGPGGARLRPWLGPVALAGALSLPFLALDLAHGRWPGGLDSADARLTLATSLSWPGALPPSALNEDHAVPGSLGITLLLGALFCLLRWRQTAPVAVWSAALGLAWIAAGWLRLGFAFAPRDLVPATLILSPCLATMFHAGWPGRRGVVAGLGLVVTFLTVWSTGSYLLDNTRRPIRPVLAATSLPPALPPLPQLLSQALAVQPWVNIDSDGAGESLFPLMVLKTRQQFTARHQPTPAAYTLLSRSSRSHHAGLQTLPQRSAYAVLPFPHKPTAGVQYLATVNRGAAGRDYFGLLPGAGQTAATDSNQFLLCTIAAGPDGPGSPQALIRVAGLNPADHAQLTAVMTTADGGFTPVATFTEDGSALVPLANPTANLLLRLDPEGGFEEIASTVIPAIAPADDNPAAPGPVPASDPQVLFVSDLVLDEAPSIRTSAGLQPTEGPFPQWNVPYIRWAKERSVQLTLPATPGLARVRLSFSVRLHVRPRGRLEVAFNGQPIRQYTLPDAGTWVEDTLEFTPVAGSNQIEFRDVPLSGEPDWLDYLERYPDVKDHLLAQNIPLEQGAQDHYETLGQLEGRTVVIPPRSEPDYEFYFMFRSIRLEGFRQP